MTTDDIASPDPRLPEALSYSAMSLFEQCEQRYAWARIYRLPDPPGRAAVLGTFVHRVLEVVFSWPPEERWEPHGERRFEAARAVARRVFEDDFDVEGSDFRHLDLDTAGVTQFRIDAWRLLRSYLVDADRADVTSVEREVRTYLGGVAVLGYIDRTERLSDGGVLVVDYKTGSRPDARWFSRTGDKHGRQVVFYGALIAQVDGALPAAGRLLYPDSAREVRIDEHEVDEVVADAHHAWEAIHARFASGQWGRTPSPLCGWCPFVGTCDEGTVAVRKRWAAGKPVGDGAIEALGLSGREAGGNGNRQRELA